MTKHLVYVEGKAQKQFKRVPEIDQERILDALGVLEKEGLSARLDVKKPKGFQRHYRVRVGNYRIRFELSADQTVIVYSISSREKAYK